MNHTLRMTPARERFNARANAEYQAGLRSCVNLQPTADNDARWMEECRSRAVAMYREFSLSQRKQSQFWNAIPGNSTARQDADYVARFSELLREHGDFEKALAAFQETIQ